MKNLIISFLLFLTLPAHAQSWLPVGHPGFTPDQATPQIAIDGSGTPYVAYEDGSNSGKATVMKYIDSNWVTVGTAGFSDSVAQYTKIAIDGSGTPYVVYEDYAHSYRATVMKFNGSSWVTVGSAGFTAAIMYFLSITIDGSGVPYIAYTDEADSNKATVMKYNGSSWVIVGNEGFSDSGASYITIAIDGSGTPYVAYMDLGHSEKATVMKYNGSSWVTVGNAGFSDSVATYTSIAIDTGGTPYVVYADQADTDNATVMKYNGSSWVTIGSTGFSLGMGAVYTSIAIDGRGTPYVAYEEALTDTSATKATVMKYDGSAWINVGSPEFSAGVVSYVSLALDPGGIPFVAYEDYAYGLRGTVMRYGWPEAVENISCNASSLTVFPDPNEGSFTCYFSSSNKEDVTITITNMLGEKVKELTATTNTDTKIQLDVPGGMYILSAVNGYIATSVKINVVK